MLLRSWVDKLPSMWEQLDMSHTVNPLSFELSQELTLSSLDRKESETSQFVWAMLMPKYSSAPLAPLQIATNPTRQTKKMILNATTMAASLLWFSKDTYHFVIVQATRYFYQLCWPELLSWMPLSCWLPLMLTVLNLKPLNIWWPYKSWNWITW